MTNDDKRAAMQQFLGEVDSLGILQNERDLSEALYTISKLGMWPDGVDSVSGKQAIWCWKLIERLRVDRLPDNLRM